MVKYVLLKTTSVEKFDEIRPHFLKYNIECFLYKFEDNYGYVSNPPLAILKEHSELVTNGSTATITSTLIVEDLDAETKKIYLHCCHGFLVNCTKELSPKPWGYDANFIPDGIMISYYDLKKMGLKISPRDMNIGKFLQDFVHYKNPMWTSTPTNFLKNSRPIDLELDYNYIIAKFFELDTLTNFIGYDFWKNVVTKAVNNGLFIRVSNTRKMNNYWWPCGNAGLPVTNKNKDKIHEKVYLMHDIFHFLVPDLLYTGNRFGNKYYEWSYTLHRVMTECFTLVLGDMFYVHYLTINGVVYETVENRKIYPLFQAIYGTRTDVFCWEILEEVINASCMYGLLGQENAFIDLFIKYNGVEKVDDFKSLIKNFRDKYDYYIILDLNWTMHNAAFMKEHSKLYLYLNDLKHITDSLGIISLDTIDTKQKQGILYFIDIGLKQLKTSLEGDTSNDNNEIKKFYRWMIGQLCFFEHYKGIPFIDGYKDIFYKCLNDFLIRNVRYQWDYLMDKCVELLILTTDLCHLFKEVYPIFDPHYISSYDDKSGNLVEIMNNFFQN